MKEIDKQDRDAAEPALRFRTLFEQAPFSVQLFDREGRILEVNKAWRALWELDEEDALDYVLNEYNILRDPQLEAKGILPYLHQALAGESVSTPPILYDPAELGRGGRVRWVLAHAHPLIGEDGDVREVMLIHEDVTARMESENALRVSELRFKRMANTIPQLAWMSEPDGQQIWFNDRWYEYTGVKPEEMDNLGFRKLHHPDYLDEATARWHHSLATGVPFEMTFPLRGRDGKYRPFFTRVEPLKDADGKVLQWFGTNTDISAQQEARDELQRALEALRASDRRKDEFLAMLAHELRNPLAPISTAAQLLALSPRDPRRVKQAGDIITRQVQHMVELVDDLLDVSRVTRGLVQLEKEPLDLKAVIGSALEQVRPLMDERRHVLVISMHSGHLSVRGDRTRLVQVIVNLLGNAARFTPPDGRIDLKAEVADGDVSITVSDSGQGIEAAFVPHVFDLFTQAARTPDRSQGGLGIGLALVKSIAALHGGRVEARSEGAGKGSVFILRLPLLGQAARSQAAAMEPADESPGPLDILIVDDNLDAARSLAALLELQGHRITVQGDAFGALAHAETHTPDVLILDIGLPDMDGCGLASELRKRPELSDALFIALTGYGQSQDRERSKAAGFDHHFVKPVDLHQLARALRARVLQDT